MFGSYLLAVGLLLVTLATSCSQENEPPQGSQSPSGEVCEDVDGAEATGTTTVPSIEYGTSVDDAMGILARAGLCGERPDVDFPHYVTATTPSAGTVVERGTHVTFEIGDG